MQIKLLIAVILCVHFNIAEYKIQINMTFSQPPGTRGDIVIIESTTTKKMFFWTIRRYRLLSFTSSNMYARMANL